MKKLFLMLMLGAVMFPAAARENVTPVVPWTDVTDEVRHSPLYGKTMVITGDSYVKNHTAPITQTWHYKIAAKYNMKYRNYGWNGNCVGYDRTSQGFGPALCERYTEMTDTADYVIVMIGHNDATMLGMPAYGGMDNFKEKMKVLCEGLIAKYPRAKLCFITPWNVPQPNFPEIIDQLKAICGQYAIPIFDAAHESGIYVWDQAFRRIYFQSPNDTAHLNDAGHTLVMNKMEHFLLAL